MGFDDFDYLDGSLSEWVRVFSSEVPAWGDVVGFIEDEYVPRFEAALHRLHAFASASTY